MAISIVYTSVCTLAHRLSQNVLNGHMGEVECAPRRAVYTAIISCCEAIKAGGWNRLTPYSSALVPAMAVRVCNHTALFQIDGLLCDLFNDAVGRSGYSVE
jgi:hypothetical protein